MILRSTYTVAELGFHEGGGIDIYDMRDEKGNVWEGDVPPLTMRTKCILEYDFGYSRNISNLF